MPSSRPSSVRPGRFVLLLLLCYAVVGAFTYQAFSRGGWFVEVGYPLSSLGTMLLLAVGSVGLRAQGEVRLITAIFNIQALGVFSLMLGIGLTAVTVFDSLSADGVVTTASVTQAGYTIAEGLVSAGFATTLAAVLKTCEDLFFVEPAAAHPGRPGGAAAGPPAGTDLRVAQRLEALCKEAQVTEERLSKLGRAAETLDLKLGEIGKLLTNVHNFFRKP